MTDDACKHERVPFPAFDHDAAKELPADEVRVRWPRTYQQCPDCKSNVVKYASYSHYLMGDW